MTFGDAAIRCARSCDLVILQAEWCASYKTQEIASRTVLLFIHHHGGRKQNWWRCQRHIYCRNKGRVLASITVVPRGRHSSNQQHSLFQRQTSSRLSAVSKKYDVNGDGKLDEAEQAMRDLDKEGRGFLTNDKVYSIFQQQLRLQKQLLLAKRLVIFFAILLVILAVANIGVAFAAARLSKDTTTTNNLLVVKDTGDVVATNNHANVFDIATSVDTKRRQRGLLEGDGTTTATATLVSKQDAQDMFNECAVDGASVTLKRTWNGYSELKDYITLCPGMSYDQIGSEYIYVLMAGRIMDNKIIHMDCNADPCVVTGSGLEQVVGEKCVFDDDCVAGSICHGVTQTMAGTCKLPLFAECWYNSECSTDACHFTQAYGAAGTCSCNPSTNSGCTSPETCASMDDILTAQGLADSFPGCYLPLNAACTESADCLTGTCDNSKCVCNSSTSYPCVNGETCINGACQVAANTNGACPSVPEDALCFAVNEPVKCGECCYTNSCTALAADASFDDSACVEVASPESECPNGYNN
jgi:hypothetical protein